MADCLFCKIVAGQIPAKIVKQDADAIVIEDIQPQAPTHVLVIPRKHVPTLNDLATEDDARALADKVAALRVFEDAAGKMNLALAEVGGGVLVVSQFTLLGDARKGNRPSFVDAAPPERANALYEVFCAALREKGLAVGTGVFRATMEVELVNDGPVTILLDSRKLF